MLENWTKRYQPSSGRTLSRLKSMENGPMSREVSQDNSLVKSKKPSFQFQRSEMGYRPYRLKYRTQQVQNLKLIPFFRVSAQSWAIYNGDTAEYIAGFNQHRCRQIASITKMATCMVSIRLAQELNLDINRKRFFVPEQAQKIGGTTSNLIKGDSIILRDLLYGLMLPSGNDAAITLAYNFQLYSLESEHFLKEMNRYVESLGLRNTLFGNVHGMYHENNYSTAYDIGKLAHDCMQSEQFRKIVQTHSYYCQINNQLQGSTREVYWENTNKLLLQGFKGVKTGNTKEAGPCVVEYYSDPDCAYIIVLLNCTTSENRWIDAVNLVKWIKKQENLIQQLI